MRIGALLLVAALAAAAASADEVFLKGGGHLSGRIVQRTATEVEIEVGAGTITVPADRVERIEEGRSALDEYHERAGRLEAKDRDGWAALGRWASDHGLSSQAQEAWQRVLAIDSADDEAHQALGHVLVNGRWLTEEESYEARGYVLYGGQWMTPEEQQAIQSQQDLDLERQRIQAEADANVRDAEARAADAEARAQAAEEDTEGIPQWWGWGPGPVLWPTTPATPATRPARGPR